MGRRGSGESMILTMSECLFNEAVVPNHQSAEERLRRRASGGARPEARGRDLG